MLISMMCVCAVGMYLCTGLASAGVRDVDKSHVARPHFQEHRKDITSSALTAVDSKEGGKDAQATGQHAGSTHR